MKEQILKIFFCCLVGFVTVSSLKSGGNLPQNTQPTAGSAGISIYRPMITISTHVGRLPPVSSIGTTYSYSPIRNTFAESAGHPSPDSHIPIQTADVILKQQSEIKPDGSYNWSYQTQNGIKAEESGTPSESKDSRKVATGSFQYTAPDSTLIAVKYVADENGFLAEGAHLPTPPPIPVEIDRALKWIAAHPQSNK